MKTKQKLLISVSVLLAVAFISGATILAAGNYGTQSDPLVTVSYLTSVFKPKILSELNETAANKAQELTNEFDAKIDGLKTELESSQSGIAQQPAEPVTAKIVTLKKGQIVSCSIGTEIMLRIGESTGTGSTPALVDSTAGITLSSGEALITNHMYIVTIEGNGFKAVTDNAKLLVRGEYSVS